MKRWYVILISVALLFATGGCTERAKWKKVVSHSEKAVEILAVEDPTSSPDTTRVSPSTIPDALDLYIRTQAGNVYRCQHLAESPICDPVTPDQVPAVRVPAYLSHRECARDSAAVSQAPGQIVDAVELCNRFDPAMAPAYGKFAILDDGNVWVWHTSSNFLPFLFMRGGAGCALPICAAILLFGIAIVIYRLIFRLIFRSSAGREKGVQQGEGDTRDL